ncbi:hypothetical protein H8S20_00065 [Clostridium sp. NSJ-6]|uniref:Uncharacterized protein n=1 Tax=Clostridium hominis TaxID=2763036 RepID=A0ABR7D951_9CLOT|nr:hypothetical protein [Clostridium hominis]MBC5627278.1 hypothetical protein [Clostridium hominis]
MLNPLVVAIPINLLIIYCIVMDITDNKKGKRKKYKDNNEDYVERNDIANESIIQIVEAVTGAVVAAVKEVNKENI